jgi:hypothetical protein
MSVVSQSARIPVVFLQGIGGAARLWEPQVTSFVAAGYAPVALALPALRLYRQSGDAVEKIGNNVYSAGTKQPSANDGNDSWR